MVTAIRASIMLAVLVGLPAAWVYYGPLPEDAQRVVDRVAGAAREALGWNDLSAPAQRPVYRSSSPPLVAAPPAPSPSPQATLAARLEPLLMQLRQLGAAAYDLQLWGRERRLYRFTCDMPLASGGQMTEQFEAIAADPRASVEQVIAEVATWRNGRLAAMAR